jgi:peptidyl-prolyl cis-trans isomerase SurA
MVAGPFMQSGRRLASAAAMLVLVAGVGRAEVVNRIVATVDGDPITQRELDRYSAERQQLDLGSKELLESLITDKLLQKEATSAGIVVKDEDIDAYIQQVKDRNHLDDARFEQAITAQGLTIPQYRDKIRGEIQKSMLVNREVRGRVIVSDEEVDRYYQEHLGDYASGDGMVVRDIMIRVEPLDDASEVAAKREKADALRKRIVGGEKFEKVAAEASEGPGKDNGGLLGTFKTGELAPELERAVSGLKAGQVTEVVRTSAGFHILKIDSVATGGHRPLTDVQDEIREKLYGQDLQKRFDDWLSKDLRDKHAVQVFD